MHVRPRQSCASCDHSLPPKPWFDRLHPLQRLQMTNDIFGEGTAYESYSRTLGVCAEESVVKIQDTPYGVREPIKK
jgi:hypothetical protein